jgi:SAM-dependent methyltransferase
MAMKSSVAIASPMKLKSDLTIPTPEVGGDCNTMDYITVCQNGGLVEERPIPGAYSSVCMELEQRIVPLKKLHERRPGLERNVQDTIIVQQKAGGGGQTGMTVWNSGLLLTRLLDAFVAELAVSQKTQDFWSNQNILDLGCGTGLCSIAAYKLGAKSVIATDGNPQVLQLAEANIQRNYIPNHNDLGIIRTSLLQWGLLNAMDFSESATLILGADLTYNAGSWRVLAETMATVLSSNGYIIYLSLGHEGLNVNPEVDGFLSVAKEIGLVIVSEIEGINLSNLLQSLLVSSEKIILEQGGGARVVILKRKSFS